MVDKNMVAKAVKRKLKSLYGDRLAKLVLYGSCAREEARPDSDIDFGSIMVPSCCKISRLGEPQPVFVLSGNLGTCEK